MTRAMTPSRRRDLVACLAVVVVLALAPARALAAPQTLTAAEVMAAVQAAASAVSPPSIIIAVVDRNGTPLAVYHGPTGNATTDLIPTLFAPAGVPAGDYAVGLARTAAFFSNNQAPLSSRTVRFISGIHFPPGFTNKPPAALYGIENTNRGCDFNVGAFPVPRAKSFINAALACGAGAGVAGCGPGIVTGKRNLFDSDPGAVDPGGVPIFKNGEVVGGIGVTGVGVERNVAEYAAFVGSVPGPAFGPRVPDPGTIFLDGIQLPFVNTTRRPDGVGAGVFLAAGAGFDLAPIAGAVVPENYLFGPIASTTPAPAAGGLSAADVASIISRGYIEAKQTRAAIRLPLGSPTAMVLSVSDLAGNILAVFRMPDATIFSIDVAVAKARNAVYFSSLTRNPLDIRGVPRGTAVTARTIGFGAMPLYPPGIDGTRSGPFFADFTLDAATPCSQGLDPANANQSGIVFFPGSMPLYRGGSTKLIGGLGVSGDGVEQDDFVTAAAVTDLNNPNRAFAPALGIRADRVVIGGVRLPFLKFPRNPEVR
jgi:uncharacterized protein GlcG (DUF336 family)